MPGSVGFDENRLPPLLVEGVKWKRENLKVKVSLDLRRRKFEATSKRKKEERAVTDSALVSSVFAEARTEKERENKSEKEELSGERNK